MRVDHLRLALPGRGAASYLVCVNLGLVAEESVVSRVTLAAIADGPPLGALRAANTMSYISPGGRAS